MSWTRHAEIWLPGYLRFRAARWLRPPRPPERLWLAIMEHYEPFLHNTDERRAVERVARWCEAWPEIARRNVDALGRPAQYSYFYPEEEYRPHLLDRIAATVRAGTGDVEIHLHHDRDTAAAFCDRMLSFIERLHNDHGLLRTVDGRPVFGFIHGNWALDNAHPRGIGCGLNNEITLLNKLGCYADFTMPSGDEPTQVHQINSIYWAIDNPRKPKSHDRGPIVTAGRWEPRDLLMIPGPLGPRFDDRRWRPKLEAGELNHRAPATAGRVEAWFDLAPRIGADIFLKLHTHGLQEATSAALLGGGLDTLFRLLRLGCARRGVQLRYTTAWGMRQAVERAARGAAPVSEQERASARACAE
jgi:hypothetical protein